MSPGAGAGAAGGDDQVGAQGLVLQQAAQPLRVVVADPHPVRQRAHLGGGGGQRVRVGVHHLTGLAAPAHVDEFVAGGHDDHPGAGPDHDVPDAGGGEDRHQGRGRRTCRRGPARCRRAAPRRRGVRRTRAWGVRKISTAAMPWSVHSTGTTTSAAIGSGAPAATEKHVPGVSRTGRQLAAPRSPTTLSRTGAARPARRRGRASRPDPPEVLPAGRVPVDGRLVEGRERVRRDDVLGEDVAVRLGEVEVERRQRAQPAQHAAQVVGERRQLVRGRLGVGRRGHVPDRALTASRR